MLNDQQHQNLDELVEHKIRRTVAKKVIKDIHKQVDEIEQVEQVEKQSSRYVIPLLLFMLVMVLLLALIGH